MADQDHSTANIAHYLQGADFPWWSHPQSRRFRSVPWATHLPSGRTATKRVR